MNLKNCSFNENELIDETNLLNNAGSHLYFYGLSHFKFGSKQRTKLFNPWFIFIFNLAFLIKFIICLLNDNSDNHLLFKIFGDWIHFLNVKIYLHFTFIIVWNLSIISQIIHYYQYKTNQYPIYLKPFEMMCGLVSPKSIGLTNEKDIYGIIKYTKLVFRFIIFHQNNNIYNNFFLTLIVFGLNYSTLELIILGFPWSLLFTLSTCFFAKLFYWQMGYFKIICRYLKIKLKRKNIEIEEMFKSKRYLCNDSVYELLNDLNSIHNEIKAINNYWSLLLLCIYLSLNILTGINFYNIIFVDINIIFTILIISFVYFDNVIIFFMFYSASSVALEANRSHNVLISFLIKTSNQLSIKTKIKVLNNII
jgi:hypothetical protein